MRRIPTFLLLALFPTLGCGKPMTDPGSATGPGGGAGTTAKSQTLAEARRGVTATARPSRGETPPRPPAGVFDLMKYDSPVGKLSAYLTPDPKDGKRRPAIVWVTGGDCNSIDEGCWTAGPPANDQSAAAYRQAGVVMLFPSLRGGNDNPGGKEGFFGEIDDVVAAAEFLARQPHVDPTRIYLGGHSTGGTVALLTSEYTGRFRAVFSFGPVDDVSGYPADFTPFNTADRTAVRLRSPGQWLHGVTVPTVVIEGAVDGNGAAVRAMAGRSANPKLTFVEVPGKNHFSVLAPVNRFLAAKILADTGDTFAVTAEEVTAAARR